MVQRVKQILGVAPGRCQSFLIIFLGCLHPHYTILWSVILLFYTLIWLYLCFVTTRSAESNKHLQTAISCKAPVLHPLSMSSGLNYTGPVVNVSHWYANHSSIKSEAFVTTIQEGLMLLPTSSLHMRIEFVVFYITTYKHLHLQKYKGPKKTCQLFLCTLKS